MSQKEIKNTKDAEKLLRDIDKAGGLPNYAARIGRPERTVRNWRQRAFELLEADDSYEIGDIPDKEMPFEELLVSQLIPQTDKKIKHEQAKEWLPVKIKTKGPFLYLIMGDQHIDDPHCNLRLFYEHVELARSREDIYVLPMGDLHNNWVGRLEKMYAKQSVSRDTAYAGIKWFLKEAGLKIPVTIAGNHDVWNEGFRVLKEIVGDTMFISDWRAKFRLVCPNGREVWIDASHDHKGHSMYNALHGQKRAALFGKKAHAFIGAHRHTPGFTKDWWGEERITTWYIRPGSYKWFDQYAVNNGFPNYQDAPAIAMVIDPDTDANNPIVFVSDDVKMGVKVLETLKGRK